MGESSNAGKNGSPPITYELDRDETVSSAVVRAVGATSGQPTVPGGGNERTVPPLFESIDPDALDRLYERLRDGRSETGRISFAYGGYQVTIENHGLLVLREE